MQKVLALEGFLHYSIHVASSPKFECHQHVPVPLLEERRGDASLVLAGLICHICHQELPEGKCWPAKPSRPQPAHVVVRYVGEIVMA